MIPSVSQYAGQPLPTGAQAKTYADDFIAVHLSEMPHGGVYSKVSAAAMANPKNTQFLNEVQTVFRGTTLRAMLLNAYAFSMIGTIMLWGAIASFLGATPWRDSSVWASGTLGGPKPRSGWSPQGRFQPPPGGRSDSGPRNVALAGFARRGRRPDSYARPVTVTTAPEVRRRAAAATVERSARPKRGASPRVRPIDAANHPGDFTKPSDAAAEIATRRPTKPRYRWQGRGATYDHLQSPG